MSAPASLQHPGSSALQVYERQHAMRSLPKQQALWVAGSVLTALLTAATSLWTLQPEVALTLCVAVGAAAVNPRKAWAAPLVIAGVWLVGLGFTLMEWPAIIGAGAAAGAVASWLVPHRTDWLDHVNGALGGLTGSSIGLWVATTLLPSTLPVAVGAMLTAGIVGLVGSQGLLPVAWRIDQSPQLPSLRQIQRALKVAYRPPVFRALGLFRSCQATAKDPESRRGMAEVSTWVFRLQVTLQTLDGELVQIDPEQVAERIASCHDVSDEVDSFTRERRQATAQHLERLLEHRSAIQIERHRTEALVDYAVAFLEEARAGLAVARELPGETIPDRLPEVLGRLRSQAQEGDARRRTARELDKIQA